MLIHGNWKILLIFIQCAVTNIFAKNYLKGENATLRCKVDSANFGRSSKTLPQTYTWSKDREGKSPEPVAAYVAGVQTVSKTGPLAGRARFEPPILHISNLRVTDSGKYSCQDVRTFETSSTVLEVNAAPTVSVDVQALPTVDKNTGLYTAAVCRATAGKPQPKIQWIQTETRETLNTEENVEQLSDGTFTVTSSLLLAPGLLGRFPNSTNLITIDDSRINFTCLVKHDYFESGGEQEVPVAINLLHSPVVTISVKSNKLTCHAAGNPVPKITWIRPDGSKDEGLLSIFVDQSTPSKSSGRYVCLAKSSVGPEAVAAIDFKESSDLPTLFTTASQANVSLPVKAQGYEMKCSAELESLKDVETHRVRFDWIKDGKEIDKMSPYPIETTIVAVSSERSVVTSVLRIVEVQRFRDEGVFNCKLSLPAIGTGYVRAMQRSVRVTVDYPPIQGSVRTTVRPRATTREFSDVKLTCHAKSSPPSSYRWFFNGKPKYSGPQLVLHNVSRHEAGFYKCIAFNYVPGSASKEVKLVVNYPPGKVYISRHESGKFLSCLIEGGSIPPPYYTWLLPDSTIAVGNGSELGIPTFDVSVPTSYTCIVGNGIGKESNATYHIEKLKAAGIGSLTIGEFIVAVIVSLLLLVIVVAFVTWICKRPDWNTGAVMKKNQDTKKSTLLQYSEHPFGGSLAPANIFSRRHSDENRTVDVSKFSSRQHSIETAKYDASAPTHNGKHAVSPKMEGKPSLVNYVNLVSKSNLAAHNKEMQDKDVSKYRSVEVLDGSGVEVLENSSMRSNITEDSHRHQSPVRMTTFSQPPSGFIDRPMIGKNYNTTRNPPREKYVDVGLTRALSENFRPVLYDDTAKREDREADCDSPTGKDSSAATTESILPPSYSAVGSISPRPTMSTPIPTNGTDNDYSSDSSAGISSNNRKKSSDHGENSNTPTSLIPNVPTNLYPSYRYNAVTHEPYGTYHPERDYRSPVPSRCQSVDPTYPHECTPPMPDIPTRNYLYHPYVEARLGIPLSVQQPALPTTMGSPYDSGSDSAKSSNATTVTSSGRRMQSLTLV